MDQDSKNLLDAIEHDLSIAKWDGEDDRHWTSRCLYSAAGRTALHILWDDERPDSAGMKADAVAPPVDGMDAPGVGSVSFYHFWKSMDRFLIPVSRLFKDAFGSAAGIEQPVWDEETKKMGQGEEADWGTELSCDDSQIKSRLEQLKKWVFSIYLETGFIRHRPMRVGPALDRAASIGSVRFLRGSWLDAAEARMSGLAMWSPSDNKADVIPFFELFLLPASRSNKEKFSSPQVRQTVGLLLDGRIAPIQFSRAGDGNEGITRFSVPFELPREERNLLLLCSWPDDFGKFNSMDGRTCSTPLFDGIRGEMEKLGYKFCERKDGVK